MKALTEHRKRTGIAAVRLSLGFTQDAMALALGISKSMLSRAENNERKLSSLALLKLTTLQLDGEAVGSKNRRYATLQNWMDAESNRLQQRAVVAEQHCRSSAQKWQKELDNMLQQYEGLCFNINKLATVLSRASANGRDAVIYRQIQLHKDVLLTRLSSCGPMAQARLRKKVTLLCAEADLHALDVLNA